MAREPQPYMQNRELSWLTFNERVLEEARDPSNPLAERLKFVSIFTSNLDEFFMIRVGSLYDMAVMGDDRWTAALACSPPSSWRPSTAGQSF